MRRAASGQIERVRRVASAVPECSVVSRCGYTLGPQAASLRLDFAAKAAGGKMPAEVAADCAPRGGVAAALGDLAGRR